MTYIYILTIETRLMYIYIVYISNELIEEIASLRKLIFGYGKF